MFPLISIMIFFWVLGCAPGFRDILLVSFLRKVDFERKGIPLCFPIIILLLTTNL